MGGIAVLFAVAGIVLAVGVLTATRHRAANAADLAAIAAAEYAPDGQPAACAQAGRVARHMSVTLSDCRLDGWDALVHTTATAPGALARFGTATARARAGPTTP